MHLRLQAHPEELQKAAPDLLAKLGQALQPHAPRAAAALTQAAKDALDTPPEPKHQVLRELLEKTRKLYAVQTEAMLQEIGDALDERVQEMGDEEAHKAFELEVLDLEKSWGWDDLAKDQNAPARGPYVGPMGGLWADPKHTVHWDRDKGASGQDGGKARVTVHHPGEKPAEGVKWGNHPGPGYRSTLNFKGKDYHVQFGHADGKFTGSLQLPDGKTHTITSPNHAANMVMLHSKGLDPTLNSYETKKLGIAYPASRLFRYGDAPATAPAPEQPKAPEKKGPGLAGKSAPLYMAAASGAPQKQKAHYALMDANDLVPSHDPVNGFRPHPSYPEGVQERRYDRDPAEQLKVHGVAQQLNPEIVFTPSVDAINGPPVLTEDGKVLGGNGRSMALQLHYGIGGDQAEATRAYLRENAGVYGFTEADVQKVKNPVVVRVVETESKDPKALATLVRRYNESSSQGMDSKAAAVGEARRMDEASMTTLSLSMPDDATLNEYLSTPASKPFVESLRTAGILNQRNASALLDKDGLLNEDGKQTVGRILTAAIIPEPNLLEDIGGQTRGTLARSAPYILAAAAEGDPEWDLRPAIQAASRDLVRARAQGAVTVQDYLSQGGLFGDKKATEGVPMGPEMLHLMWSTGDKPLVFSKVARAYLAGARQNPRGQESLFAVEKRTPAQVLGDAVAKLTKADLERALTGEDVQEWLELSTWVTCAGLVPGDGIG